MTSQETAVFTLQYSVEIWGFQENPEFSLRSRNTMSWSSSVSVLNVLQVGRSRVQFLARTKHSSLLSFQASTAVHFKIPLSWDVMLSLGKWCLTFWMNIMPLDPWQVLQKVKIQSPNYAASHPRRLKSSIILFTVMSKLAQRPTQPIQWELVGLSWVSQLRRDGDLSPPSGAKAKNEWSYTPLSSTSLHGMDRVNSACNFAFLCYNITQSSTWGSVCWWNGLSSFIFKAAVYPAADKLHSSHMPCQSLQSQQDRYLTGQN